MAGAATAEQRAAHAEAREKYHACPERAQFAWSIVMSPKHTAPLQRIAKAAARRYGQFGEQDAEEIYSALICDLVDSFYLFDPDRGDFLSWAKTRAGLVALQNARQTWRQGRFSKEGRLNAQSRCTAIGASSGRNNMADVMDFQDPLPVGSWGTAQRSEALVELRKLDERADEYEQYLLEKMLTAGALEHQVADVLSAARRSICRRVLSALLEAEKPPTVAQIASVVGCTETQATSVLRAAGAIQLDSGVWVRG